MKILACFVKILSKYLQYVKKITESGDTMIYLSDAKSQVIQPKLPKINLFSKDSQISFAQNEGNA